MTRITLDLDDDLAAWAEEQAKADGAASTEAWLAQQAARLRAEGLGQAFPDWPEEAFAALAADAEASGEKGPAFQRLGRI